MGSLARQVLGASTILGAWLAASPGLARAQPRRAAGIHRLEVASAAPGIDGGRLRRDLRPVERSLFACRGERRAEPITILLRLGPEETDAVDTVRHGARRDVEVERCVREALAEWRPTIAAWQGSVEIVLRHDPPPEPRSPTTLAALGALVGGAGTGIGSLGTLGAGLGTLPAARRRATLGPTTIQGSMERGAARRALEPALAAVELCAGRVAGAVPTELRMRLVVRAGRVLAASGLPAPDAAAPASLAACIGGALRRVTFPAVSTVDVVTQTFRLGPVSRRAAPRRRARPTPPRRVGRPAP